MYRLFIQEGTKLKLFIPIGQIYLWYLYTYKLYILHIQYLKAVQAIIGSF